jgi:hypothetical protein
VQVLDLSSNQLTSTLPGAWGQLARLSVLNLNSNLLEGSLPSSWARQRSLLQLNIGSNRLEGVLPRAWSQGMDSLRGVNFTGNRIQGSLPKEWANMTSLQSLCVMAAVQRCSMHVCVLLRSTPAAVSACWPRVRHLAHSTALSCVVRMRRAVGHNQLTGSVPEAWGALHQLYAVNVTHNSGLCGPVPSSVSRVLEADNTALNDQCMWAEEGERGGWVCGAALHDASADPATATASWPCPELSMRLLLLAALHLMCTCACSGHAAGLQGPPAGCRFSSNRRAAQLAARHQPMRRCAVGGAGV